MATRGTIGGRWLVLIHQLPPRPSNLRVRVWRRLQHLGAVAFRHSVYVLPNTAETREDFEWLRAEILGLGGSATVMVADITNADDVEDLLEQFREPPRRDYDVLAREIKKALERRRTGRGRSSDPVAGREAKEMRERFARIRSRDYFEAESGPRAADLLRKLETAASNLTREPAKRTKKAGGTFRGRTWVTRARPGVDRMASAWFIRRFVDRQARFMFVSANQGIPAGRIPFDMFGVEFGHHGSHCTLETLIDRFAVRDPAAERLAQVVHDLDLKDGHYDLPECATTGRLVDGLRRLYADDNQLLAQGMVMMEALYRSFARE
jgi:hypothetical protein